MSVFNNIVSQSLGSAQAQPDQPDENPSLTPWRIGVLSSSLPLQSAEPLDERYKNVEYLSPIGLIAASSALHDGEPIKPRAQWQNWFARNGGGEYITDPLLQKYWDVANGRIDENFDFDSLFSNNDKMMSKGEFDMLPPEVQAEARKNPQLFIQSVLSNTANKDHGDLLSVGAEGGFGDYKTARWDPQMGLVPDQSKYLSIHEEPDWALYATLAVIGGAALTAMEVGAAAGAGAGAAEGAAAGSAAGATAGTGAAATGGAIVGSSGALGSTGYALADAALNAAAWGSVKGAFTAAISGGDVWKGALTGGLTGGITGGLGSAFDGLSISGVPLVDSAIKGAATGGLTAAVSGGDAWKGALTGGTLAAISPYLKSMTDSNKILTNAINGGVSAAINGGDVATGMLKSGAMTAADQYGSLWTGNELGGFFAKGAVAGAFDASNINNSPSQTILTSNQVPQAQSMTQSYGGLNGISSMTNGRRNIRDGYQSLSSKRTGVRA